MLGPCVLDDMTGFQIRQREIASYWAISQTEVSLAIAFNPCKGSHAVQGVIVAMRATSIVLECFGESRGCSPPHDRQRAPAAWWRIDHLACAESPSRLFIGWFCDGHNLRIYRMQLDLIPHLETNLIQGLPIGKLVGARGSAGRHLRIHCRPTISAQFLIRETVPIDKCRWPQNQDEEMHM